MTATTLPTPPFWFRQRQGVIEAVGENSLKLTGPNLPEAFIEIRPGETGRLAASLRSKADGPVIAASDPEFDSATEAWQAAFELHRQHITG